MFFVTEISVTEKKKKNQQLAFNRGPHEGKKWPKSKIRSKHFIIYYNLIIYYTFRSVSSEVWNTKSRFISLYLCFCLSYVAVSFYLRATYRTNIHLGMSCPKIWSHIEVLRQHTWNYNLKRSTHICIRIVAFLFNN